MASKVIRGSVPGYDGTTALYAIVTAQNGATSLNGAGGDTVTFGALNTFTFTWTESITGGVYDVQLYKTSDNSEYTRRSKVYVPSDAAGTYDIDDVSALNREAFNNQVYPYLERSVNDTNAFRFLFPTANATFTTKTVSIDFGTAANIQGTISYIGALGNSYEYQLAYDADDRPTAEGIARYTFSDGTNTRYVTMVVIPGLTAAQAAKLELLGTASAAYTAPVSSKGTIEEIIRGDDYLAANGRAFQWTWTPTTGYVRATSDCFFGGISACDGVTVGWSIEGIITEVDGVWTLAFDMDKATTAALADSQYNWSVQVTNAAGYETTPWKSRANQPANVVDKQT